MNRLCILLVLSFAIAACSGGQGAGKPVQSGIGSHSAPPADQVLGVVDGLEIRRRNLPPEADQELKKLENESKQRQLHILWVAVDDAVSDTLLGREAERRGITVEELRDKEVGARLVMPTDDVIRKIFDSNRDIIPGEFDTVAGHIKRQLVQEQLTDLNRAFIAKLRSKAEIQYAIPIPELPRFAVALGEGPILGADDAPVTLVEYSDFECPYCGRASRTLEQLRQVYPTQLKVAFRDFPLSQHENAKPAAEAAQCAHEQGKFWEYHDKLFENSKALAATDLKSYADEVGIDLKKFAECLASDRPGKAVADSMKAGREVGVQGTPAIFINGIKLIGLLPMPLMRAIIDNELASR